LEVFDDLCAGFRWFSMMFVVVFGGFFLVFVRFKSFLIDVSFCPLDLRVSFSERVLTKTHRVDDVFLCWQMSFFGGPRLADYDAHSQRFETFPLTT
jgi:hypothetical protein